MIKEWKKVNATTYTFLLNEKEIGNLEMVYEKWMQRANFYIADKKYVLTYTGFWKSNLQIEDEKGHVVLKTYAQKWFSSTSIIEYNNKKWLLKIRNNPMAEYVIFDGEKEILGYGLSTEIGKASVRINTNAASNDLIFDYLLWYLFLPMANENIGDGLPMQFLLTNQ